MRDIITPVNSTTFFDGFKFQELQDAWQFLVKNQFQFIDKWNEYLRD